MMLAKKCDLCGRYYDSYNTENNASKLNGFMLLNIDNRQKYFSHTAVDLCPHCMDDLLAFIKEHTSKGVETE